MSYTYLQEQGEESSAECFSDIPVSVLLRLNLTAEKCSCNGSEMESCHGSQSGMTCELSMGNLGAESPMLFALESHAKKSALLATVKDSSKPTITPQQSELFARFDRHCSGWKTVQLWFSADWGGSSVSWPKWGIMQHGACFRLPTLEHDTSVKGFGLKHPTPTRRDYKGASDGQRLDLSRWTTWLHHEFSHVTKTTYPNPDCSEAVMGWPIGWTALRPLAMDKFQQWLDSHGRH